MNAAFDAVAVVSAKQPWSEYEHGNTARSLRASQPCC